MQPRRRLIMLGFLGLGLGGYSVTSCAGDLVFEGINAPVTDLEKRQVRAAGAVEVEGQRYPIGFQTLLRAGDRLSPPTPEPKPYTFEGAVFGQVVDSRGIPIRQQEGTPLIANDHDFASLLDLGSKGLWMISHVESHPAAMYLTQLDQDLKTGALYPTRTRAIDFSAVGGGWAHCAGSVTPWRTHLGSEEYEPDARRRDPKTGAIDAKYNAMAAYYSPSGPEADDSPYPVAAQLQLNPYNYGWPVEVEVLNAQGETRVIKHHAMARVSLELAYVMPDQKTVYLTDDGANAGLYLFIADRPADLTAGMLYAAKWTQQDAKDGGRAELAWIDLGHASYDEIKAHLNARIGFGDLFEVADPVADQCPEGFSSTNAGHEAPFHECLRLKPGMAQAASRLETRRYAALQGATTEWRKMEGITFDPDGKRLFLAISEVAAGMKDNPTGLHDIGGLNDIRLPENTCGTVYTLAVGRNERLGSDYVAKTMSGELQGIPVVGDANNACHLDGIANPDNLTFIPGYATMLIAEDSTSGHQNNALWAYDVSRKTVTRVVSAPYGAEVTSPYVYPDINGWAYIMTVIQHPYEKSDADKYQVGSLADRAYTGYLGSFKLTP